MPDTVFYRLHHSALAADGTITLAVSIYDDEGHSSAASEVNPADKDYPFWQWILRQKRYARILDEDAVGSARDEYDRFCTWRDGASGATS